MQIRKLDEADLGYALFSWRESAKKAPEYDRVPWGYYKDAVVPQFKKLLDEGRVLGAYADGFPLSKLVGWLAMTPGKRVHTVHWVHVKHELEEARMRRCGVMMQLLDAADLGQRFIYTLRARRLTRDERAKQPPALAQAKTLDELLVAALREKGVTATHVSLKEWLK